MPCRSSQFANEALQHIMCVLNTNVDGKQKIMFPRQFVDYYGNPLPQLKIHDWFFNRKDYEDGKYSQVVYKDGYYDHSNWWDLVVLFPCGLRHYKGLCVRGQRFVVFEEATLRRGKRRE
ncbi:unnamed protein product [Malus baccata var. baccata]